MSNLSEVRQTLEAYCQTYLTSSLKLKDKDFLSEDARKDIEAVAELLGVDYSKVDYTFEYVVRDGEGAVYSPAIAKSDDKLVISWSDKRFPLDAEKLYEVSSVIVDDNRLRYEIAYNEEDCFSFSGKVPKNVTLPPVSVINSNLKKNKNYLTQFLMEERNIESLASRKESFTTTVKTLETLQGKGGKTYHLLVTEHGTFWSPFEGLFATPAQMRFDAKASKVTLETQDLQTIEATVGGMFRKFSDLEDGKSYKVTGWRVANSKFGDKVELTIDGKYYGANTAIAKVITALKPELTEEKPGTLEILGRKEQNTSSGTKVVVKARFIPPASDMDELAKKLAALQENLAAPAPF